LEFSFIFAYRLKLLPVLEQKEQDVFYLRLGELIRDARKRVGFTQEDLAKFIGLKRTSLVNIEQGEQRIQLHALIEIAVHLKIEPAELLAKLYVLIDKPKASAAENKEINKMVSQLDSDKKEENTELLQGFVKFTKYKS
jgi:transcriptional regulator with XRE-family HTH domain